MKAHAIGVVTTTVVAASLLGATPTVLAAPAGGSGPAGVIVAHDAASILRVEPSGPRTVTVSAEPRTVVTIKAKGLRKKKMTTDATGQATFTKLKAGTLYTVSDGDQRVTVVPVLSVGKARGLTVTTTDRVDTVDLTWSHKATTLRGGSTITYTVTAVPANAGPPITMEVSSPRAVLTGLDPTLLYAFSVVPRNALGDGASSTAAMSHSLTEITGLPVSQEGQDPDQDAPTPAAPPSQVATPPAAPTPAPRPAPAPRPSTRTIWVCPEPFVDVDGVCTQTQEYTFHDVTETQEYTYRTEFVNTGWRVDPHPCSYGTMHPDGCWVPLGYDRQVKNAAPAGWTDNGTSYERTVSAKDDRPAGWSDTGSAWIRTTGKLSKSIPA